MEARIKNGAKGNAVRELWFFRRKFPHHSKEIFETSDK